MVVVGFDVGKENIYGARVDRSGQVKEHYELANNVKAIRPVLVSLRAKYKHLMVASEATAEYHRPLALTCLELAIPFRLLNPITTKQFVRSTVRKRKTDKTDAEVIARVALQGEGTLVTEATFCKAKSILRSAVKLTQTANSLKLVRYWLDEIMPEEESLTKQLLACQEQLEATVKAYRARANQLSDHKLIHLLSTIPGIGPLTAMTLVAEIGDISRFKGPKALIAYAGLDPKVRQSGKTLQRNTRLTKRGSPYLRRSIYYAATVAERWDPGLKATFDRKRSEGKRYKEATLVVARRTLNCVYAVWTTKKPYRLT